MALLPNGEPEYKRVRRACLNCRRKKTRCPGERPACTFCVRLGQVCRYADSRRSTITSIAPSPSTTITVDPIATDSSVTTDTQRNGLSADSGVNPIALPSGSESEGDFAELGRSMSLPKYLMPTPTFSSSMPPPAAPSLTGESANDDSRTACFKQAPPPHIVARLADVYFSNCQNQPYCFFHEGNMRKRLNTGDLPQYLLLVFAASAVRYSRDDYFKPNPLLAVSTYASQAWAMLRTHVFESESCPDLEAAQATTLLAVIDFTAGQHRQAWVKIGLAIRLVQDLKLNLEPDSSLPYWQQEERRRVFWSVYLLDRLFACGNDRPVSILDTDCTVRLPRDEESFRVGSDVSDTPTLAILQTPWQSDSIQHMGFSVLILMTSLLGRTVTYTSRNETANVPCWDPRSGFAEISSILMSFESMYGAVSGDLTKHINDLYGTYEGYDRQRVGHFIWSRALYHFCGAMLYRPHHLYKHRRNWKNNFPDSFARGALDQCRHHIAQITNVLETVRKTGCCARGSSLGYIASCAASMHKIFLHSPDETIASQAACGLDTCLQFLQQPPLAWPNYSMMIKAVKEFDLDHELAKHLVDPQLPPSIHIEKSQLEKLQSMLDYAWLSDRSRGIDTAPTTAGSVGDQGDWAFLGSFDDMPPFYGLTGDVSSPSLSQQFHTDAFQHGRGLSAEFGELLPA
ncbi:uncharacterized protein RCC_09995 [Ramularia collo-cygni]|uniref:Zn(2)-C6 fungal-type domain-containing protein n=1 Tax=Ramularia collo-cygni TaxID=112498 RepID=A0A2D3VEM7_9PEZI|nr:uncharacterized protein RCC_09995 [Ramularia collo-cygni]CZT24275.1 uncharacterized protein RCC_09995 [Ramularia collo-cygni]